MNINTRSRIAGATATLGMLLAFTACGTETVSETDPGVQPVAKSRVIKGGGGISADSAERKAAAEQARQDRASTLRWDRGAFQENRLKYAGHPGRH
jgi:hypothetical protein